MKIKELRESRRLTQSDLATSLNVGRTTVAMWEAGGSLPRAELLPKIAKLFGCTVDELLKDDGEGEKK